MQKPDLGAGFSESLFLSWLRHVSFILVSQLQAEQLHLHISNSMRPLSNTSEFYQIFSHFYSKAAVF